MNPHKSASHPEATSAATPDQKSLGTTVTNDNSDDIGRLSFGQALFRGVTLRCPACARGRLFRNMFQMHAECGECGFRFERAPGYFLGSTYINYGITALTTTVSYVVLHFGLGYSRDHLLPGLLAFCLIFPLVFFRFARSLWLALDCFFDRVGASESMSAIDQKKSRQEVSDYVD
ncbi:MAG: DUF983 domain-containing protein [Planctomycetaceae bacterium]